MNRAPRKRSQPRSRSRDRRAAARRKRIWRAAYAVCALVFIYCAVRLIVYGVQSAQTKKLNRNLQEMYENPQETAVPEAAEAPADGPVFVQATPQPTAEPTPEPTIDPDKVYQYIADEISESARNLYYINEDLVGWVKIPGVIDLPVVYRDNSYYLTHNFYRAESNSGTVFMDVGHPLQADTQYLFLHGHAMYDGTMFGMLTHYRHMDYIKEHPYLTLNTLYSSDSYEIIGSAYLTEDEMLSVANLGKPTFPTEGDFQAFMANMRRHALHFTKDELPANTPLLALSTCYKEGRIVVLFKRTASVPL